ncbi:MAG: GNAT family N-acetyltransferase [Phycisphaerae bacterium]|nr:GNAT family N-acetyltransferase [Phycisphaerae bacterium]
MLKFISIDNLKKNNTQKHKLEKSLASQIIMLVRGNIEFSNDQDDYNDEDLQALVDSKTIKALQQRTDDGLLIYVQNGNDEIIACGLVTYRQSRDRYESKMLHVRNDYRGQGLAKKICEIREEKLRNLAIDYIYIESLKFPKTIAFHQSRGFEPYDDGHKLQYSVLMRKKL